MAATASQAKAIFAGECDIALGNTYYVGLMQTNEKEAGAEGMGGAPSRCCSPMPMTAAPM